MDISQLDLIYSHPSLYINCPKNFKRSVRELYYDGPNLENLSKDLGKSFPKISSLEIYDVPSLKGLPEDLSFLKRIRLTNVDSLKYFPKNVPKLYSLDLNNLKSLKGLLEDLSNIIFLTLSNVPLEFFQNLSNLEYLTVSNTKSLEGITQNLNNLKKIEIIKLNSFKGFPKIVPNLKEIKFSDSTPSFKDLPQKLPSLESIEFRNSIIPNFEDLTSQMPKLESIYIGDSHIHNFIGIPKKTVLSIQRSTINSFEGLVLPIPHNTKETLLGINNCTIRSLSGISKPTLHAILIQFPKYLFPTKNYVYYYKNKYYEFDNEENRIKQIKEIVYNKGEPPLNPNMPPQALMKTLKNISIKKGISNSFEPTFLNIPKTAMKLIEHTKNPHPDPEITRQNDFREFITNYPHLNETDYDSRRWSREYDIIFDEDVYFEQDHTIEFPEDILFPDKLEMLYQYYRKSARQLAQEYITAPKTLPPDQIERLIHEIDPQLRNLLENNLPPSDPLIKQMSAKFAFKMENGLKILK